MQAFHAELRGHLEAAGYTAQDGRVRALLELAGRHEKLMELNLARYEGQGEKGVLETWLQFTPEESLRETFENTRLDPEMSMEDVVQCVIEWDQTLLDLYRQFAGATAAGRVQELFASLAEMEEAKQESLSWSLLEFQHEVLEDETPPDSTAE